MVEEITTENGWPKPATVIGNTDETVVRILAHINRAGKELNDKADFVSQKAVHSFSTASSTVAYALPSDFKRFQLATQYDQTTQLAFGGPLSDQQWEAIASAAQSAQFTPSFKVIVDATTPFTNEFNITPTPSATETIQYRYISDGWVLLSGDSSRTTTFNKTGDTTADADTSLIDEELVKLWATFNYLESLGFPFAAAKKRAEDLFDIVVGSDGGNQVLSVGPRYYGDYAAANTPNRGFG